MSLRLASLPLASLALPFASMLPLVPSTAAAQVRASEPASVSQTVDGTEIAIRYSRPVARGRTGIFGRHVKLNHTWTPGANMATTLRVSKDVTIENVAVPKGTYSVWFVLAPGPWELVLDRDSMLFHTQMPRRRAGQVRIPITREHRPFLEVLTWSFPQVRATGATLVMHWDTVAVPLRIGVPPSFSRALPAEQARPLVGRYRVTMEPPPPNRDTTIDASIDEPPPRELTATVTHEGGELRMTLDPPMFTSEPGYRDWVLLPKRGTWFTPARFHEGEMVEIMDFFAFRFVIPEGRADARASALELRLPNDQLIGRGERLP